MSMAEFEGEFEEDAQVEIFRRAIQKRIALESDRLVDELFNIAYDGEADARAKLSAITILLDRALPKMSVQKTKEEEVEERGSRKALREEIERMMKEKGEEEDEG